MLAERMWIDVWEVVEAASTMPYGFMRFSAGAGHGRPLPARRSVLPDLASARVSDGHRVHRAGREINQQMPSTAWSGSSRRSTTPSAGEGLAHPDPRRQLQGRGGRHPRIAGAADHGGPPLAGRPGQLSRRVRARAARARTWRACRSTRPLPKPTRSSWWHTQVSTSSRSPPGVRCSSTSAGSHGERRSRTWCVCEPGRGALSLARRIEASRARSSVGERSLHTREVAGSNPAVPIRSPPQRRVFRCLGRLPQDS